MNKLVTKYEFRCLHKQPLDIVKQKMTNFDHSIENGLVEAIGDSNHMADYAGWNFHAYVYLANEGLYVADVHCYKQHAGFVTAKTLKSLMKKVCEKYGYE